jgi:hypothetical protein
MPMEGGLCRFRSRQTRGWSAFADHDDGEGEAYQLPRFLRIDVDLPGLRPAMT